MEDILPGDILLTPYSLPDDQGTEVSKLVALACKAIEHFREWDGYSANEKRTHFAGLAPLIHFSVTLFGESPFIEAALVIEGAEEKQALCLGANGVQTFPLTVFLKKPASVYRYRHGAIRLGDSRLPVEPVLKAAKQFSEKPPVHTSFHMGLLAIWSLFRAGNDDCLPTLQNHLVEAFGNGFTRRLLANGRARKLANLFAELFHRSLDHWRQSNQMLGSELVATCFNTADTEGTYRISRETSTEDCGAGFNLALAAQQLSESELQALTSAIDALKPAPPLRPVRVALALVQGDKLYSPKDLSTSISTFHVGNTGGKS